MQDTYYFLIKLIKFIVLFVYAIEINKKNYNFFFFVYPALAFHDVDVSNEDIGTLGVLWVQIFVYEENCIDNQYYTLITQRLAKSPRFQRYSSELDHLTESQELAWENGAEGEALVIESGGTSCDIIAEVIWEWFGENQKKLIYLHTYF